MTHQPTSEAQGEEAAWTLRKISQLHAIADAAQTLLDDGRPANDAFNLILCALHWMTHQRLNARLSEVDEDGFLCGDDIGEERIDNRPFDEMLNCFAREDTT